MAAPKRPARKSAPKKKMAKKPKAKASRRKVANSSTAIRQQNLGQQTESSVVLRHGRPDSRASVMRAVSARNQYVYQTSSRLTTSGATGRQAWGFQPIANTGDLATIGNQLAQRLYGTQAPPARYLLENCKVNLKFSNVGQANVKLTILHVRAKRDIYADMEYTSPSAVTYLWNGGDPITAIQQGVAAATAGSNTGSVAYLIPGIDETESPIFRSYYNVIKRTEIFLSVGGTHKLTTNCFYDRVLDASVYANVSMTDAFGITDQLIFKAEGQTGVLRDEDQTMTISPCQLGYTIDYDYSFCQVAPARQALAVADLIGSTSTVVDVISGSTGSGVTATGLVS